MIIVVVIVTDGIDGTQVGQLAIITRSNFTLFSEAVKKCVYSDSDVKVAFAGVCLLFSVSAVQDTLILMDMQNVCE